MSHNPAIKDVYRYLIQPYGNPVKPRNRKDILDIQCWSTALLDPRLNNPPLLTGPMHHNRWAVEDTPRARKPRDKVPRAGARDQRLEAETTTRI